MATFFSKDKRDPVLPATRSLAPERLRRDRVVTLLNLLRAELQHEASGETRTPTRRMSTALKTLAAEIDKEFERDVEPFLRTVFDFYPLCVATRTDLLQELVRYGLAPADIAALCVYGDDGNAWHPEYSVRLDAPDSLVAQRVEDAAQWVRTTLSRQRGRMRGSSAATKRGKRDT